MWLGNVEHARFGNVEFGSVAYVRLGNVEFFGSVLCGMSVVELLLTYRGVTLPDVKAPYHVVYSP